MYIKESNLHNFEMGAFISYNNTSSHLLSIKKIILTYKNEKLFDIITIRVPIFHYKSSYFSG